MLSASLLCGCGAFVSSRLLHGPSGSQTVEIRAEESEAALRCGGKPCGAVEVERDYTQAGSGVALWSFVAAEAVAGAALFNRFGQQANLTGLFALLIAADLGFYFQGDTYQRVYGNLRLRQSAELDWRGKRLALQASDLVPNPTAAEVAPKFSAAKLAGVRAASGPKGPLVGKTVAVFDLLLVAPPLTVENGRFLTDVLRTRVLTLAPGAKVVTRENMLELLKAHAGELAACSKECDAATGRSLGADVLLIPALEKAGNGWRLSLRLNEAQDGRQSASAQGDAADIDALEDVAAAAADRLLSGVK